MTRVSQLSVQTHALQNLQHHMGRMAKLQDQMTTRKKFIKPSEDPTSTVTAMRVRADQRVNSQYMRNINDGKTWTTTIDTAIQNSTETLRKVRDLTVQGANTGSYGPSSLRAIATEVRALSGAILQQANTQINGRSVFAGTSDQPTFTFDETDPANPVLKFNGKPGSVERRVSDAITVRVDADGDKVFGEGDESVFALLENIASALERAAAGDPDPITGKTTTGTDISKYLADIDARMSKMTDELALVGTSHNQLLRAESDIGDMTVSLEAQRSAVEEIDLAEATVKLSLQEVTYQASLSATSRALQPSLLDFLR